MRENYGEFPPERDNSISTIRDELKDLSDDILTNELPHNELETINNDQLRITNNE